MGQQTHVKKALLAGTTPRITFQIVDQDSVGFQPDTLTMSIYDVVWPMTNLPGPVIPPLTATQTIINSRNDVDVLANCDALGNVQLHLTALDTAVTVPGYSVPSQAIRRVLFTWTWDTGGSKVGKHEVLLTIAPDRETVAS